MVIYREMSLKITKLRSSPFTFIPKTGVPVRKIGTALTRVMAESLCPAYLSTATHSSFITVPAIRAQQLGLLSLLTAFQSKPYRTNSSE